MYIDESPLGKNASPAAGMFGSEYNNSLQYGTPYSWANNGFSTPMGGHSYFLGTKSSANTLLKPYHTYGRASADSTRLRDNNEDESLMENAPLKGPSGVIYGSKHLWQSMAIGHHHLALFTDRLRDWFSTHLLGPLVQSMDGTESFFQSFQLNNLKLDHLNINVILSGKRSLTTSIRLLEILFI
jgi:hypothetical protein